MLKSKLQAVIQDPTSASHVLVAESAGSVRRLNIEVSQMCSKHASLTRHMYPHKQLGPELIMYDTSDR